MEIFVELKMSCQSNEKAQAISGLFQSIAERDEGGKLALVSDELKVNSEEVSRLESMIDDHAADFGSLENSAVEGNEVNLSFVCGLDAEEFLLNLAELALIFKCTVLQLTAKPDEGLIVCEIIEGEPHVSHFEDMEDYKTRGFEPSVNLNQSLVTTSLPEPYLGKWISDFHKALHLRIDELRPYWESLDEKKKAGCTNLEDYIQKLADKEASTESEELTITEEVIDSKRKVYGNSIREKVTYTVTKIEADLASVTEYLEEMGDIEEFQVEMTLLEGGEFLQIQRTMPKRTLVYRKK